MRRADRLFRIVQLLRSGRLLTATRLAEKLEVSARTVYRDVRDLQLSGMPITGEAGVGYTLRRDFDLPPLLFTREELTALVLGARMVRAWGGAESSAAALTALARIEAVLPPDLRDRLTAIQLYVPSFQMPQPLREHLDQLHEACIARRALRFHYTREDGAETLNRTARPLALYFWSGVWTLVAWCELRDGFRTFRTDRMRVTETLDRRFEQRSGQQLADFLRSVIPRGDPDRPPSRPARHLTGQRGDSAMAIDPAQHTRPARNMDPAQDDRDPGQINPDGTPGPEEQITDDLETTQTGGSRNERVTEFAANRHRIEPAITASGQPGYQPGTAATTAEGASSHPLSDELAQQAKLKNSTSDAAADGAEADQLVYSSESPEQEQRGKLPTGMAEKIETVEISGMRPKR